MDIDIVLPFPPSTNTYWRMFQNRMIISKAGREYRKAVQDAVMLQKANKHFDCELVVTIEAYRPDNRRRDLDNLLKATLDSLTHAGVYLDDSQIIDLRIYWAVDKGGILKIKVEKRWTTT
jgi:crossover junction endodeoxyribonuclease RusA